VARRSAGVPQEPGYGHRRPGEPPVILRKAENGETVAYGPDEYGVRKDDGGGLVKPVSSARGLLFMALFVSALDCLVLYGLVRIAIDGTWEILAEIWWVLLVGVFVPWACWSYYLKERRAEKLRGARNLPRPVE
jgi:hypothetical protein